jgi:hypothetical protein
MAREQITQMLYLLDDAFEGPDWHSFLTNLGSVTPDDWDWVPPNGARTIRQLVGHVGECKFLYHNRAFGDAQRSWAEITSRRADVLATIPSAVTWLREGHQCLREGIAALEDDSELVKLRLHHSGKLKETRWIIMIMMQHDLYHAGEINHIRALRQQNDDWG